MSDSPPVLECPLLHVVLVEPEIPQNTGNIGRTCVAVGAKLWLVRPLGYELDAKHLRRAGMDYWPKLTYEVVDDWADLRAKLPTDRLWALSTHATAPFWEADFAPGDAVVLGCESRGLPEAIHAELWERRLTFPTRPEARSLNLGNTASVAAYEFVRRFGLG